MCHRRGCVCHIVTAGDASLASLDALKLMVDGFEANVYGFFKAVSGFVGNEIGRSGKDDLDDDLLVHGGLRLNYSEGYIGLGDVDKATGEAFDFLVDELRKAVGDVEVDGVDTNVHSLRF